jgi:hypothetical protein
MVAVGRQAIRFHRQSGYCSEFLHLCQGTREELRLDIEAGRSQIIGTVMGSFLTCAHLLTLSVLEISFDTTVYLAEEASFNRNVSDQQGWLDRLRLGLVDYEGKLYLSDYNDVL